jgi:hypothetical protein
MSTPSRSTRPGPRERHWRCWSGCTSGIRPTETALVSIARDNGDFAATLGHARELLALDPGDAQLQALVADLEKKAAR